MFKYCQITHSLKLVIKLAKKAVIVISLVEEAKEREGIELEREISEELTKWPVVIPWMKDVEKVTVVEEL